MWCVVLGAWWHTLVATVRWCHRGAHNRWITQEDLGTITSYSLHVITYPNPYSPLTLPLLPSEQLGQGRRSFDKNKYMFSLTHSISLLQWGAKQIR